MGGGISSFFSKADDNPSNTSNNKGSADKNSNLNSKSNSNLNSNLNSPIKQRLGPTSTTNDHVEVPPWAKSLENPSIAYFDIAIDGSKAGRIEFTLAKVSVLLVSSFI